MDLYEAISRYQPVNDQEQRDQAVMLQYMRQHDDYLLRENLVAHFTVSLWTVNEARTKVLMAYHNIYQSWAWLGGHADGVADLRAVALRELQEETGVRNATIIGNDIFSLEILTVEGHEKQGVYVPSHLHMNVTYLAVADEQEPLVVCEEENQAVQWWPIEEAMKASREPWFVERIYPKLAAKCRAAEWQSPA